MAEEEQRESESSQEAGLMEALGPTVLNVQKSFGSIYSTLEKGLEQNMRLSQAMMGIFDEIYKTNLKIGSSFKPAENGKVIMSLIISNRTKLPVIDLGGIIEIKAEKVDIRYKEALDQLHQPIPNIFKQLAQAQEEQKKCDFMPNQQYLQEIEITLNELVQCNGEIRLNFINALNNKPIEMKHTFGIYLIDQMNKSLSIDSSRSTNGKDEEILNATWYSTVFIREIMAIHPAKGIEKNMVILLKGVPQIEIKCRILDISEDLNQVQVGFYSEAKDATMNLIKELDILQK